MLFRSGKQWDPDVVAAFFQARDDLREIVRRPAEEIETSFFSASVAMK